MSTFKQKRAYSFCKTYRLHYPWEFRRFFDKSEVLRLSECVVFRIPNQERHYRLGITLKARGTSVERNKVKRTVREGFRKLRQTLGSYDYNVVIPASKKMTHPYPQKLRLSLQKELSNALDRH